MWIDVNVVERHTGERVRVRDVTPVSSPRQAVAREVDDDVPVFRPRIQAVPEPQQRERRARPERRPEQQTRPQRAAPEPQQRERRARPERRPEQQTRPQPTNEEDSGAEKRKRRGRPSQ